MSAMTDKQVRAKLERMNEYYASDWDEHEKCKDEMPHDCPTRSALRLLAESQQALGEIAESKPHITHMGSGRYHQTRECDMCNIKIQIARKHWKGGK